MDVLRVDTRLSVRRLSRRLDRFSSTASPRSSWASPQDRQTHVAEEDVDDDVEELEVLVVNVVVGPFVVGFSVGFCVGLFCFACFTASFAAASGELEQPRELQALLT